MEKKPYYKKAEIVWIEFGDLLKGVNDIMYIITSMHIKNQSNRKMWYNCKGKGVHLSGFKYFLMGFKNVFTDDISEIKSDYPVHNLWEKSKKIESKFKVINEKARENIKKHIYSAY